jgi:uncharacterized protein YjbJ (UPF0337 family)
MADKHKGEELKGRAKEALGDLTNNDDLKRQGKIDQGSARTKDKIGKAADSFKDVTNPRR